MRRVLLNCNLNDHTQEGREARQKADELSVAEHRRDSLCFLEETELSSMYLLEI